MIDQPPAPADARPAAELSLHGDPIMGRDANRYVPEADLIALTVRAEQAEARLAQLVEGLEELEELLEQLVCECPVILEDRHGSVEIQHEDNCFISRVRALIAAAKQDQP